MEQDSEFELLLSKYEGGRIPPLADLDTPGEGLVNGDLLRIYHSGLKNRLAMPVGILMAASPPTSPERKWLDGDYTMNEWAKDEWSYYCRKIVRGTEEGNQACEKCDRRWASVAERHGKVITYLCDFGLIDFAVPVLLHDKVVAIVFGGQFRPKPGQHWNPEMLKPGGYFRPLATGEKGVDLWIKGSVPRISAFATGTGRSAQGLPRSVREGDHSVPEISPEDVSASQDLLSKIAGQLSMLATSTFEAEKGKLVDLIRNQITGSLLTLGSPPDLDIPGAWQAVSNCLDHVRQLLGVDYVLTLVSRNEEEDTLSVIGRSGLSEDQFPLAGRRPASGDALSDFKLWGDLEDPATANLRDYRSLPFLGPLYDLHRKGKRAIVVPVPHPLHSCVAVMLIGRFEFGLEAADLTSMDREALRRIAEGVGLVAEIVLLVEKLEQASEDQAAFLEDVAHDIRTPIQTVIVQAEAMTGISNLKQAQVLARRMAGQVRRMHLMSQKAWTLARIQSGYFRSDDTELISVHPIIMDQRKSLLEVAEQRTVDIAVASDLADLPKVQVNRTLFSQAVINLLDNAVKYSRGESQVRVQKRHSRTEIVLTFGNRGIPIREEEKEPIFRRYWRSKEAQMRTQEGSGIGLAIVQAFVDSCGGGIDVTSEPIAGSSDYLTVFALHIPTRG